MIVTKVIREIQASLLGYGVILLVGFIALYLSWWWVAAFAFLLEGYLIRSNVMENDYKKIPVEKWDRKRLISAVKELQESHTRAKDWEKKYLNSAQLTDDEYAVLTQIAFHLTAYDKQKGKISAEATLNHLRAALNYLGPEFSKEVTEDFGPQEWNQMYDSMRNFETKS